MNGSISGTTSVVGNLYVPSSIFEEGDDDYCMLLSSARQLHVAESDEDEQWTLLPHTTTDFPPLSTPIDADWTILP